MKSADEMSGNARGSSHTAQSSPHPQPNTLPLFADAGFNAVFDSSGEALIVVDRKGLIQQANVRARELLRLRDSSTSRAGLLDFFATPSTVDFSEFTEDVYKRQVEVRTNTETGKEGRRVEIILVPDGATY